MLFNILFSVAFISQIVLISVQYPRRIRAMARTSVSAAAEDPARSSEQWADGSFNAFATLNHVIGVIGLVLLPIILGLAGSGRMTAALLSLGLFFLVQLSPLALPGVRRLAALLSSERGRREAAVADMHRTTKLRDIVGTVPVGVAALLFPCYLLLAGILWDGEVDPHLLKMVVFTSTQLLFVGSIAWGLLSLKRASAAQVAERYLNYRRLAPLMVFASILISVYYFGKELLAVVDEPLLRPTMMSVALQLLGVCAVHALYFGWDRTRFDPPAS